MARGRSERSRREKRRKEKPVVLIVCEGETELAYFKALRTRYRAQGIVVKQADETNPAAILEFAKRAKREMEAKGVKVSTWVVFDAESTAGERERRYRETIGTALGSGMGVANSSPCFEYWALLHYSPGIMVYEPAQAVAELAKEGRAAGYSKPNLPFEELWQLHRQGVPSRAAARRRNDLESLGEDPRFGRPVTYVDVLVDGLVEAFGSAG
ncbi:MAG: RloB family protein [Coriobacteriales bacterium]